jgi:hypothetical protein
MTAVAIGMGNVGLVRLIFQVISDGHRIESIANRFLHAYVGPHVPVRKYSVLMKVADERLVSGYVRKNDGSGAGLMRERTSRNRHCDCDGKLERGA